MKRYAGVLTVVVVLASSCGASNDVSTTTAAVSASSTSQNFATTSDAVSTFDAPQLGGTNWNVTTYRLPSGSITNVWLTDVTISFGADGTISGSAGCNDFTGTWQVSGVYDEFEAGVPDSNDGQELSLRSLSWTEIACEDESIMEQESEILDLLQQGERWLLKGETFHLRDATGSFLFEAESL
jgi:heat shock protein HslJ